ncbi:MAG: DUF1273 domain-containing protein [Bacteroides sp.]|nr:DUF1273 domain-containing protein [Bacteroides sp.]
MNLYERLERIKNKSVSPVTREDFLRSAAFTGYRPEKLPFGSDYESEQAKRLRYALYTEYDKLFRKGFKYFLTGGAMGSDLMAADVILQLKKEYGKQAKNVMSIICLPCHEHFKSWAPAEIEHLEKILSGDTSAFYVSDRPYYAGCMQERNKYMVDTSAVLIAVYDGKPGGTKNTVDYARSLKRKIVSFRPDSGMRVELFSKKADATGQLNLMDGDEDDYAEFNLN